MNFLIRRVQNYAMANGVNIYDERHTDFFNYNDMTNEFDFWNFEFAIPSVAQLEIDYPDTTIEQEIALRQLRAYRNAILRDTDKFITTDYPLTTEVKGEILTWRQLLRDLPSSISSSLLVLNSHDRLDLTGIFPATPITGALLTVRSKFPFLT